MVKGFGTKFAVTTVFETSEKDSVGELDSNARVRFVVTSQLEKTLPADGVAVSRKFRPSSRGWLLVAPFTAPLPLARRVSGVREL